MRAGATGRSTMGAGAVVFFVFLVAVLNLCLGYALAVYFGHALLRVRWVPVRLPGGFGWGVPVSQAEEQASAEGDNPLLEGMEAERVGTESIGPDDSLPASAGADDEPSGLGAPEPEREKSFLESSLDEFQQELEDYRAQLCAIDRQLRVDPDSLDARGLERLLEKLQATNESYLARQGEAAERFRQRQELGELSAVGARVEAALDAQSAQIETTNNNIRYLDYQADAVDGARRIAGQIAKLLDANYNLRDQLDEALLATARHEERLTHPDERLGRDRLTGLVSRAGIEAALDRWWKKDRSRSRQLAIGLVDLDQFKPLNETYGPEVGDRVLQAIGQVIAEFCREQDIAGRLAGQRFAILFPDSGPRAATGIIERIRQSVAAIHFQHGAIVEFQVSATCGVAMAEPRDTAERLYERAATVLAAAKRVGRDHTFLREGDQAQPVIPPVFHAEARVLPV